MISTRVCPTLILSQLQFLFNWTHFILASWHSKAKRFLIPLKFKQGISVLASKTPVLYFLTLTVWSEKQDGAELCQAQPAKHKLFGSNGAIFLVWIVDGCIVELLNCWIVELLICWIVEWLNCWSVELLNCWVVELLNCWGVGLLDCWIVKLLNCWSVEVLKCWNVELLNCWMVELLNC